MPSTQTAHKRKCIPARVKNNELVEKKRRELVNAAVGLFTRKGFHRTTTRELAEAAGWSVGLLYEYVKSKEDVLYLVCEAIHRDMEHALRERIGGAATGRASLEAAIAEYMRVCDRMQDAILLIYRETGALDAVSRRFVLRNEERITRIFEEILRAGREDGTLRLRDGRALRLMAHNVVVLGHMWAFRRWFLAKSYTVDEYSRQQTALILNEMTSANEGSRTWPP
ncbi:MAG: TetR/AcrR family transcriptional regulator [Candidatus Hydrogenedentes bacterium]|nr:TetR/AcrR family transcriptional regulator [Candidatus Hydrogenedentota bacterium]